MSVSLFSLGSSLDSSELSSASAIVSGILAASEARSVLKPVRALDSASSSPFLEGASGAAMRRANRCCVCSSRSWPRFVCDKASSRLKRQAAECWLCLELRQPCSRALSHFGQCSVHPCPPIAGSKSDCRSSSLRAALRSSSGSFGPAPSGSRSVRSTVRAPRGAVWSFTVTSMSPTFSALHR